MRRQACRLLILASICAAFLALSCGREEKRFDPYVLYNVHSWESYEDAQVNGDKATIQIVYRFYQDGSYYYKYKKYSTEKEIVYSEIVETGTYRASETEIVFTPENGVPYSVLWEYDEKTYELKMTYSDGTSIELGFFTLARH